MYMAEALNMICRKRGISNPKEWGLMLKDPRIPIPLDRTVASLQGKSDLLLIKRADHPNVDQYEKRVGRTTDPNGKNVLHTLRPHLSERYLNTASILKRQSEIPQEHYPDDFTAAYKVRLISLRSQGKRPKTIEIQCHPEAACSRSQ
jgi:hypothetical protein